MKCVARSYKHKENLHQTYLTFACELKFKIRDRATSSKTLKIQTKKASKGVNHNLGCSEIHKMYFLFAAIEIENKSLLVYIIYLFIYFSFIFIYFIFFTIF